MKEKYIKAKIEIKMEKSSIADVVKGYTDSPLFYSADDDDGQIGIASDEEDGGW